MGVLVIILGGVIALAGIGCSIMILVEAFQDETWKGIVGIIFPIYLLYYGIFEFDHDHKWPIVLGSLFGAGIGGMLLGAGASMMGGH